MFCGAVNLSCFHDFLVLKQPAGECDGAVSCIDRLHSVTCLLSRRACPTGDGPCLGSRLPNQPYQWMSYREVGVIQSKKCRCKCILETSCCKSWP